jgi:hypothetical protein
MERAYNPTPAIVNFLPVTIFGRRRRGPVCEA